ncbi:MAG: DNA gyrase inhibitor YacG [Steroidobacter sp.]
MTNSITCPTCKRNIEWSTANKWRPFCSERCKLIDLGAWASEQHVIPDDSNGISKDTASDTETPAV